MKPTAWIFVALVAPLAVATTSVSARIPLSPQTVAQKTADGADKAKDAVVTVAKAVGNTTKDGVSKTGEVMTDAWVTTRVHGRFVGVDVLKDSDISVDTSNHVVTLKGTVMTRSGRAKASSVAMGTEGVRRVVNKLTVGPKHKD
jgi:hyperosmotically inducible protein